LSLTGYGEGKALFSSFRNVLQPTAEFGVEDVNFRGSLRGGGL